MKATNTKKVTGAAVPLTIAQAGTIQKGKRFLNNYQKNSKYYHGDIPYEMHKPKGKFVPIADRVNHQHKGRVVVCECNHLFPYQGEYAKNNLINQPGMREFEINGRIIIALNRKNAERKAAA